MDDQGYDQQQMMDEGQYQQYDDGMDGQQGKYSYIQSGFL